jgi:hypothetical protein
MTACTSNRTICNVLSALNVCALPGAVCSLEPHLAKLVTHTMTSMTQRLGRPRCRLRNARRWARGLTDTNLEFRSHRNHFLFYLGAHSALQLRHVRFKHPDMNMNMYTPLICQSCVHMPQSSSTQVI